MPAYLAPQKESSNQKQTVRILWRITKEVISVVSLLGRIGIREWLRPSIRAKEQMKRPQDYLHVKLTANQHRSRQRLLASRLLLFRLSEIRQRLLVRVGQDLYSGCEVL